MERDQNIEIRERERVPILRGKKIYDPLIKTYFGHLRKKFVLFMLSLSGLEKLRKNLVAYRTFSRPSMDHPGHVTFFFILRHSLGFQQQHQWLKDRPSP